MVSDSLEPRSTIHEAELASGASGAVIRGNEISFDDAIVRRTIGRDVVICGDNRKANRSLARDIESKVGPYVFQIPHSFTAGPKALPHFQQKDVTHKGHSFYETSNRRSVRKSP